MRLLVLFYGVMKVPYPILASRLPRFITSAVPEITSKKSLIAQSLAKVTSAPPSNVQWEKTGAPRPRSAIPIASDRRTKLACAAPRKIDPSKIDPPKINFKQLLKDGDLFFRKQLRRDIDTFSIPAASPLIDHENEALQFALEKRLRDGVPDEALLRIAAEASRVSRVIRETPPGSELLCTPHQWKNLPLISGLPKREYVKPAVISAPIDASASIGKKVRTLQAPRTLRKPIG